MRILVITIISLAFLVSCNSKSNSTYTPPESETTTGHHVKIAEIIQTSSYTYLFVNEKDIEYWMAVNKVDMKVGDDFYYEDALQMLDFKSKELDRVFDSILFVQAISDDPVVSTKAAPMSSGPKTTEALEDINVTPVEGGITIGELYKNRNDYANKKVIVTGQVVKVNESIMGRNWVHLQDGTEFSGNYDLTVTTEQSAKVGDQVTFEATVTLDKDFGAGYTYELILEDGILK